MEKELSPKLGRVVASRTLTEHGPRANRVEIVLGAPRRLGPDWECPFLIRGLGGESIQTIAGSDSLQALQLAIQALRVGLEETGRRFLWSNSDPAFGSGIARDLPLGLGEASELRIKRFIEREVKGWANRLKAGERPQPFVHASPPPNETDAATANSKLHPRKSKKGSKKTR